MCKNFFPPSSRSVDQISWLDGWRGAALYLMVVYHLLFDCALFGWLSWDTMFSAPMWALERIVAFSFILCAGVSATLTRSNLRRGAVTLLAGGLVTAVSYIIDAPILFGVLQFLGLSMVIYGLAAPVFDRVPERVAPLLWCGGYIVFRVITDRVLVDVKWLFWLGFACEGFTSFDYFPMLPWFFVFLFGTWMGHMIQKHSARLPILKKTAPGWLAWPGRRTLLLYLVHQPILFGVCMLISALT